METFFVQELFIVLSFALFGGLLAKLFKVPTLIGYILSGILFGWLLPIDRNQFVTIANLGVILLLFTIGMEFSWRKLSQVGNVVIIGGLIQVVSVITICFLALMFLMNFEPRAAITLSLGFTLSSTAVLAKILTERGEMESLQGKMMIGWSIIQDLCVIPIIVLLSSFNQSGNWLVNSSASLAKAGLAILVTILLGKKLIPYVLHKIASLNSKEVILLTAMSFALGIAGLTQFIGISVTIGAFLAGIVISESREKLAIFSETRPLRDFLLILFFVTLGFLITPSFIAANLLIILGLTFLVVVVKFLVVLILIYFLGYKGKVGLATALGLAQVGEFAFVIFLVAQGLGVIDERVAGIGISTALLTLIISPVLFNVALPLWRKLKSLGFFTVVEKQSNLETSEMVDHIIICGFGRVGKWVGKAFNLAKIKYLVIDYSQSVYLKARDQGIDIIYGDPSEPAVLEAAGIKKAKSIVIALPDRNTQEEVISFAQTINPNIKIVTRAHLDEDWRRFLDLKVGKVVQPEFEAALAMVKFILVNMGRPKAQVIEILKVLRHSRAKTSI